MSMCFYDDYGPTILERVKEYSHWFRELMAYFHGDGGQYLALHGPEKATMDAINKYTMVKDALRDAHDHINELYQEQR